MGQQDRNRATQATVDTDDMVHRAPSRPRRRTYQARGLPLEKQTNLHLFALPEHAPTKSNTKPFPAARQIAANEPRNLNVRAAAACVAALTAGATVFALYPGDQPASSSVAVLARSTSLPQYIAPMPTVAPISNTLRDDEPRGAVDQLDAPAGPASLPRLTLALPRTRVAAGPLASLNTPASSQSLENVPVAANAATVMRKPQLRLVAPAPMPFDCGACANTSPELQTVAITLFAPEQSSRTAAQKLRQLGVSDLSTAPNPIGVRENQVRFYHAADAIAANTLARRFDANLVDLTWFGQTPAPAQLELWLAAPTDPS